MLCLINRTPNEDNRPYYSMKSTANTELIAEKISLTDSGFLFLKYLEEYIQLVQNDTFLKKALDFMYSQHENESVALIKAGNRSDSEFDDFIRQEELQPIIDEKYPIFEWKKLKEANERFQLIKQYGSENEIPDITITIPEQVSELGTIFPTKVNLQNIPHSVEIRGWRNYFNTFNKALIGIIEESKSKGGIFSKYFDFDSQGGVLYFQGKEIIINERKKITNAHYLLSYLFTNDPFDQHFYSELETSEALLENKSWKSYYDACVDIQAKVQEKTRISDFLDFSSGPKMYVRINPKYSTLNS